MKGFGLALAALATVTTPAAGFHFYVTPEVPADLTGAGTVLPWHVARHDTVGGTYGPALTLPSGTAVDGLHRMDGGDWLLSVEAPADLGGTTFLPQDVILYDPGAATFSPFFCGGALGFPAGSNVDALFLSGGDGGTLVVSLDAPTTIGADTYDPADLVEYVPTGPGCADWALAGTFFDASASFPPVPASTDVTGADSRGGLTIVSFDVPTTLGGTTFLPGELVSWSPPPPGDIGGFTLVGSFYLDPAWPDGARIDSFSFIADPGRIPPTLTVARDVPDGTTITLSWSASCSAGAEDYAIYEGMIGSWYSHTSIDCADDGVPLTESVTTSPGDTYYLVVPLNPNDEGSYGTDSSGIERPAGSPGTCAATQVLEPCS